jgi:hypothetical protein
MEPQPYQPLRTRLLSLSAHAGRLTVSDGMRPTTMKHRIQRVAAARGIPFTIRRLSGGILFWRSSDADLHEAHEVAHRLQTAQWRRIRQGTRRRASHGTPITGGHAEGDEPMIHLSRHGTTSPTPRQPLLCGVLSMLHIVWQF